MSDESPGPLCGSKLGPHWLDRGTLARARFCPPGPQGLEDEARERFSSPYPHGTPGRHPRPPASTTTRPPPLVQPVQHAVALAPAKQRVFVLENGDLALFLKVFSTLQAGWPQRVEVVYADGKTDPIWAEARLTAGEGHAAGSVVSCTCDDKARRLDARLAIDLAQARHPSAGSLVAGLNGSSRVVFSQPTVTQVREQIFRTLVHELLHVVQGWVLGKEWPSRYAEAGPYAVNRYEKAAFLRSEEWVADNRQRLAAGEFDIYWPRAALDPH